MNVKELLRFLNMSKPRGEPVKIQLRPDFDSDMALDNEPRKLNDSEIGRHTKLLPKYIETWDNTGVHPLILMAIISRETRCKNVIGDNGHGHGFMQIDDRYHPGFTESNDPLSPLENLKYGAELLVEYYWKVASNHPSWTHYWALRGAFVAYNSGVKNVQSQERIDVGTTGNDYSYDVMRRMLYLESVFYWLDEECGY